MRQKRLGHYTREVHMYVEVGIKTSNEGRKRGLKYKSKRAEKTVNSEKTGTVHSLHAPLSRQQESIQ